MENLVSIRGLGTLSLYLLCCLSFGALAEAKAVLSGPSHAVAGDIVTLQGQHFSAGESYSIKTIMGKKTSQQLVTADQSGSLSFQLVTGSFGKPHQPGRRMVRLLPIWPEITVKRGWNCIWCNWLLARPRCW